MSPGESALLISPIGEDPFGRLLVDEMKSIGMRTDGLTMSDSRTAVCNMILDESGTLIRGVADMGITADFDAGQVELTYVLRKKTSC